MESGKSSGLKITEFWRKTSHFLSRFDYNFKNSQLGCYPQIFETFLRSGSSRDFLFKILETLSSVTPLSLRHFSISSSLIPATPLASACACKARKAAMPLLAEYVARGSRTSKGIAEGRSIPILSKRSAALCRGNAPNQKKNIGY